MDEVIAVDGGSSYNAAKVTELAGARVVQHGENKGYWSAIQSILTEAKNGTLIFLLFLMLTPRITQRR